MGTYGDKPLSRFKTWRLKRRFYWITGVILFVTGALLLAAILAFKSETFWRKFVIPRYFGPYWETAISWDSFDPHLVPPGIYIEGLNLHEPNAPTKSVLRVEKLDLLATIDSLVADIDIREVDIEGVSANVVQYGPEDTNLSRFVERVYQGLPPPAAGTELPGPHRVIPEIKTPAQIKLPGVSLRYENRVDPHRVVSFGYVVNQDVLIDVYSPDDEEDGLFHEQFAIRSEGELALAVDGTRIQNNLRLNIVADSLKDFPDCDLQVAATLFPIEAGDATPAVEAEFRTPLVRTPIRLAAVPIEDLSLRFHRDRDARAIASLEAEIFDPLTGEIRGDFLLDGNSRDIVSTIGRFLPEDLRRDFETYIKTSAFDYYVPEESGGAHFQSEISLDAKGMLQYAIVDEEEDLPLELTTSGWIRAFGMEFGTRQELRANLLSGVQEKDVDGKTVTGDADIRWHLNLNDKQKKGSGWLLSDWAPTSSDEGQTTLTLSLKKQGTEREPVDFSYAGPVSWQAIKEMLRGFPPDLPMFAILPSPKGYDEGYGETLASFFETFQAVFTSNAELKQDLTVHDSSLLEYLLQPGVVGNFQVEKGEFDFFLAHDPAEGFTQIGEAIAVEGIALEGVSAPVDIDVSIEALANDSRLYASQFESSIRPASALGERGRLFSMKLARSGPNEELGPLPPTYLNYRTGEGQFAIRMEDIQQEALDVLTRLKVLGLSERLSGKAYTDLQRLLDAAREKNRKNGEADLFLSGKIGEDLQLSSVILLRDIPLVEILRLPWDQESAAKRYMSRVENELLYNLEQESIGLRRLAFDIFPDGDDQLLFRSRLESSEELLIGVRDMEEFLDEQILSISSGELSDLSLEQALALAFTRAEELRSELRGGDASVVLLLPDISVPALRGIIPASHIPVTAGTGNVYLEIPVNRQEAPLEARGRFSITRMRLEGLKEPVPQIRGEFKLSLEEGYLQLEELVTTLPFSEGEGETHIRFSSRHHLESDRFLADLEVDLVGKPALAVLENIGSGVGEATELFQFLPTIQLGDLASPQGQMRLKYEIERQEAGGPVVVSSLQEGRNFSILPALFGPFHFRVSQELVYQNDGSFVLSRLDGKVSEMAPEPLVCEFDLKEAVPFNSEGGALNSSSIQIDLTKNLTALSGRSAQVFFDLMDIHLESGWLEGHFDIAVSATKEGRASTARRLENSFSLNLRNLRLRGANQPLEGVFTGLLVTEGQRFAARDLMLSLKGGEEEAGRLEGALALDTNSNELDFRLDVADFQGPLLKALPFPVSVLGDDPQTRLHGRADISTDLDESRGRMDLALRLRDFSPRRAALEEETDESPEEPVQLDINVASTFDRATSTVLLQDISAQAVSGRINAPGQNIPISSDLPRFLTIDELGAISFDLGSLGFTGTEAEESGIKVVLGPIDIEPYSPLLMRLAGIPLEQGILSGEGTVVGMGPETQPTIAVDWRANLENGLWKESSGRQVPLNAFFQLRGETRPGIFRIEEFDADLVYNQGVPRGRDHLGATGFYETSGGKHSLVANVESDELVLSRVLRRVSEIQENLKPTETKEQSGRTKDVWTMPSNFEASVSGALQNIYFRELWLPLSRFQADIENQHVYLREAFFRPEEGVIQAAGTLDFSSSRNPWTLHLDMERLNARAWVNSLAPAAYYGDISGSLSATADLAAEGLHSVDLRESLNGRISFQMKGVQFREGKVVDLLDETIPLDADGVITVRNNRAQFEMGTPWNPARTLFLQGTARPIIPPPGQSPHYRALIDYRRTSTVGPEYRREEGKAARQELYGMLLEVEGILRSGDEPRVNLRTMAY